MVWRRAARSLLAGTRHALAAEAAAELPRGHIPALDAIRGLAIVLVTLYRFGGGGEGPARAVEHAGLMALGSRGVDLFFVLSGFLITGILLDAKGREHYFRNFYMRRTLRIFPLYYAALLVTLLILPRIAVSQAAAVQPASGAQAWLWLYGANIVQSLRGTWCLGALNHFWSLAIEEHFYLVWPLAIFLLPRRGAMWLAGGLAGASILARATWLACGGNDVAAEVFTPLRMDGLLVGSWVALAARADGGFVWLQRFAWPVLFLSGGTALMAELLGRRLFGLPHAAWAAAFAALLVVALAAPRHAWLARLSQSRWLQFFGKYSYGMYVWQLPLVYACAGIVTAPQLAGAVRSAWLGQTAYCGLMFALTTVIALASWHAFEKHWLVLKNRFGG
jgi:peptidoglycan/LPS O-acetylase OafA/YrhL